MFQVNAKNVQKVLNQTHWDLGNEVLYKLCRQHPQHKRDDEIIAKVWLIGRSYAASIERRPNADGDGDKFYQDVVAPALKASKIDSWISGCRGSKIGAAETVVVHKRLTELFYSFTTLEKRSLASKYLHFHVPDAFFIYDSRARAAVAKITPRLNRLADIEAAAFDKEYKYFVRRCLWLKNHIVREYRKELSPRQIDKLLLLL